MVRPRKFEEETEEETDEQEDGGEGEEESLPDKKPKQKERWSVQDVPTQTAPMVVDVIEGKAYTIEIAVAKILNNQERILKSIEG